MIALALQSGSNGNCLYVETAHARLLFDAGISGSSAARRLALYGRDVRDVDAALVSHDHSDHVRCAGVFHRKFGLPVFMSRPTFRAAERQFRNLPSPEGMHWFRSGEALKFDGVVVETVPTPHDAADGVAFVVAADGLRLGVLTDLGHVFRGLGEIIESLDAVFIESNYDPEMLAAGPYPPHLQARIRGPRGHLSNIEAAELLRGRAKRLRWACLAHLSEHNNRPTLALRTHHEIAGGSYPLSAASRYEPTGLFTL